MFQITQSLIPIIVTIILGYALKRSGRFSPGFFKGAENLTYYILMPTLLINILANQTLTDLPWHTFLTAVLAVVVLCAAIIALLQVLFKPFSGPTFTSWFQGGVRFNTFIALALVSSLYGDIGLSYSALAVTGMIIFINFLCVASFTITLNTGKINAGYFFLQIVKNPLIIAATIGISLNISGLGLNSIISDSMDLPARAAFPIGLMLVGAALSFKGLFRDYKVSLASILMQFLLKPILALYAIHLLGISGIPAMVIIIFFCVPTAPSAYILASKLGGDTHAMASIITLQTLMAFITIPLTLYVASWFIQ